MKTTIKIDKPKDTSYFTVQEAADELGINTQTIRDYLVKGIMKTYKFKTLTLISKEEVKQRKQKQK
jgi:excisionase family DNA binding protein